jgi:alpha-L-rhamnosidase
VRSSESTQVSYSGPTLRCRQRYFWQVRIWDAHGQASAWSSATRWEMALLTSSDWSAKWIGSANFTQRIPMLRRAFVLHGAVKWARAYVTAQGLYQLFINGQHVGDSEFTPGFTSYNKRLQYQTYDISALLKNGYNAVGALLGEGWFTGVLSGEDSSFRYGDHTAFLAQLEVIYQDGTTETISTDEAWKESPSPILMSNIYAGETYDARLEQAGWHQPGFDDSGWTPVQVMPGSYDILIAQASPPVRQIARLTPKRTVRAPNGEMIIDMGQNMVGWVNLTVQGSAGTTVSLRHGEVLDGKGQLYTANLDGAKQTVRYTLSGHGVETYSPHFTFQGFRYVAVEGYPGEIKPESITGIVLQSDIGNTGEFETSNALINHLQHNIVWGEKGNFLDIPTDCPQRDERQGWTGDAEVFASTAAFNGDVMGFFEKWLQDLSTDQYASGSVPWVVPDVLRAVKGPFERQLNDGVAGGVAGWGDAATIIPWTLYLAYGDRQVLEVQYASMRRWVDYERIRAGPELIWSGDFQLGDFADWGFESRPDYAAATSSALVATAYFAHSADLLARAARVLGRLEDAAHYEQLFAGVRAAFVRRFVSGDGKVGTGTQTAYVLALQFELLPATRATEAAGHLAENVRREGHLTTGFLGTAGLLFALSDHGHLDEAYRLLLNEANPSWMYAVDHGATTIWERWDGIKPDGSFQDPAMNSFNHYARGAVGEWMYQVIGGINLDPASPGYKHIRIRPRPGGGLTYAYAAHLSAYGRISSSWRIKRQRFDLDVEIPPNTNATVTLPGAAAQIHDVFETRQRVTVGRGIASIRPVGSDSVVELGSGTYHFSYQADPVLR